MCVEVCCYFLKISSLKLLTFIPHLKNQWKILKSRVCDSGTIFSVVTCCSLADPCHRSLMAHSALCGLYGVRVRDFVNQLFQNGFSVGNLNNPKSFYKWE